MKAGDKIRHPLLGPGTVVAIHKKAGRDGVDVDFGYMTDWVPASELDFEAKSRLSPSGSFPGDVPLESTVTPLPSNTVDARRGVMALKLGQILERHVVELSTETDDIQRKFEAIVARALQRQASGVLIEGDWGSGKTHLLTMLRAIAASRGMASSSVILDGSGVRLSDPKRLMEAILESLRYPDEVVPHGIGARLGQFKISRRFRDAQMAQFEGPGRIAQAIDVVPERAFDEPEILEILEDYFSLSLSVTQARTALAVRGYRGVHLPSMAVMKVDDRPRRFCELLEGWTEFVVETGAKGLILIVDEVDVEYASTRGYAAARLMERVRRARLLLALRESLGVDLPLVVAFGSAPAGGAVLEEDDAVGDLVRWLGDHKFTVIQAPKLELSHMRDLLRRVTDLYKRGYPERLAKLDNDVIENGLDALAESYMKKEINPVPRRLVRRALEYLDVLPDLLR